MKTKQTRISKKKLQEWIDSIANIEHRDYGGDEKTAVYVSKIDGSYITHVGMENQLKMYYNLGIRHHIQGMPESNGEGTVCIGFNPEENKWYGWSHRAIYGFTIDSICKHGDCHFKPGNVKEFIKSCASFWGDSEYSCGDDNAIVTKGLDYDDKTEVEGVLVSYTYNDKVPNEKLRETKYEHFSPMPKTWGKGEWVAKTIEEAKQMAIDFAEGVS